jgi:tetratricopeptide (TPR) repeat protein/predicted Ser/Thr protein kinase
VATDPDAGSLGTDVPTELDTQHDTLRSGRADRPIGRGETLGRYVVLEKIGAGGMGVVYAAYDPELDRKVALKLLHAGPVVSVETRDSGTAVDASAAGRDHLLAEAQAMARLSHRNVITVHDVGTIDDRVFIAMEYVEGWPLSKWMRQPERTWREILGVFLEAARGLEAAHAAGLVHRDFKPDNVLVSRTGEVRVLDFGLARLSGEDAPPDDTDVETASWRQSSLSKQTHASRVGTPAYMSPEQHLGQPCDARSDQFSFCVACYEGLYGKRPFAGRTPMELALAIADGELIEPPRDSKVPGWVRRVLLRGLRHHPEDRHADMSTLIEALSRDPGRALRRWGAVAAVAVGALGAGIVASDRGPARCSGASQAIAEVWDDGRRSHLRTALLESGLPYAKVAAEQVEATLDGYADAWAEMHTEACQATAVRHEQSEQLLDRRMVCLERRRIALDQLVDVLAQADRQTVERAVDAARALPDLAHCADVDALMAGEPPPPPGVEREQLDAVDRELAKSAALEASGRVKEGLEAAQLALAMSRELGSASRQAEASMAMASHYLELDDGSAAEPLLYRTVELADRSGQDRLRAAALSGLVGALGRQRRFDQARRFANFARAAFDRVGSPAAGLAQIERELGVVALREGRLTEARDHFELALEKVLEEHDEHSPAYLDTLNNLALTRRDLGEYESALESFRQIRDEWRETYGERHPGTAIMTLNMGTVLSTLGKQDEAIAEYEVALETFETAVGPDCLDVGYTAESMAIAHGEQGRYDQALKLHERAQSVFRAHGASGQADLALSLDNMGVVFQQRGEPERALETHRQALAQWQATVGEGHPDLGYPLGHIGDDLRALGRLDEARPKYEMALALFEKGQLAPDEIAGVRFNLAKTWREQDPAKARALASTARAEYAGAGEAFADRVAKIDAWVAELGPG